MKNTVKLLVIIMILFSTGFSVGCQPKMDNAKELEEKITQLDKAGWEAWKNKNGNWFEINTTANFISISADGVSDKKQVIHSTISDCNVNRYALSKMKFVLLDEGSVLLTYTVDQEGTCGGTKLNSKIRVAANYIKQNNQWLEAFYMESKID